tara:strand:- start:27 stop:152 length:126 start_codon:yes stop_codon:yes gene_type:complete
MVVTISYYVVFNTEVFTASSCLHGEMGARDKNSTVGKKKSH